MLKRAPIALSVDVPEGLVIDGYPGSYGQILTNLFLNAANHAFADGRSGTISISARPRGADDVEIIFADNGAGMTPGRAAPGLRPVLYHAPQRGRHRAWACISSITWSPSSSAAG